MDSTAPLIVPLREAADYNDAFLGGKAIGLGRLIGAGYRVPDGFCISANAYQRFVEFNELEGIIRMELGRKPFADMRWEEMWDAALRIRSQFLSAAIPGDVIEAIADAYRGLQPAAVAVRSSAPGEDSAQRSYAGLHETLVGVVGGDALTDAVRVVWASLWSDAALLYRQELGMDPHNSRMAVVVQTLVTADVSGVGFCVDPREPGGDTQIVEAVPGLCDDLVSGAVDPDRWIMKRSSGDIVEWRAGDRPASDGRPILERADLALLHQTLQSIEALMGWPADVEWTGASSELTLLQARPVTRAAEQDDERAWYLTLRPGKARLDALCARVTEELIPELEAETARLAREELDAYDDARVADTIEARKDALERWKKIYWDEFIPFAHGVRQLGLYYNDAVRPTDPYEFVALLKDQPMIASARNAAMRDMAALVVQNEGLGHALHALLESGRLRTRAGWSEASSALVEAPTGPAFVEAFDAFQDTYMNVAYDGELLDQRPELTLRVVLELATEPAPDERPPTTSPELLEKRFLDAVGPKQEAEALEVLRVARLSWQLRDDDNILIGRLENQLRRALELGAARLRSHRRLDADAIVGLEAAEAVTKGLRDSGGGSVALPAKPSKKKTERTPSEESARQMIGQPAAPGLASGRVRVVRSIEDMGNFRSGEIIVCDAIQPTMTHLLPLAGAVVERRGGMLIHGAIIARELGIPCVNGVVDATNKVADGDIVTVDGHLGIVTVGLPEFDLEIGPAA